MKRRALPWFLLVGLILGAFSIFGYSYLDKMEADELFELERSLGAVANTARAYVQEPLTNQPLELQEVETLQAAITQAQEDTGFRIRVLDQDRQVIADSLKHPLKGQDYVRFRPEIQKSYHGEYGAYTRLSDVTDRSLALFVAVPVVGQRGKILGAIYASGATDAILFRLGKVRRQLQYWFLAATLAFFLGTLLATGRFRVRLQELGAIAENVEQQPEDEPLDDMGRIGRGLERLVASLEQKVAELQDEKIRTKRFVEEIAHELKTPVTALQGSVEALKEEPDPKLLENVQRETERLSELVGLLIELQKLEYYEMNWQTFEMTSLLEMVADGQRHRAKAKGVNFQLEVPEECLAKGDSAKLRRVLENLLDNAVRCSPEGSVITLSLVEGEECLKVTVADQGPGVPVQEGKAIFERGRGGTTVDTMGLGLSVASEIIRMHQQKLDFESSDQGAAFTFTVANAD